jgi:hypothetical protein
MNIKPLLIIKRKNFEIMNLCNFCFRFVNNLKQVREMNKKVSWAMNQYINRKRIHPNSKQQKRFPRFSFTISFSFSELMKLFETGKDSDVLDLKDNANCKSFKEEAKKCSVFMSTLGQRKIWMPTHYVPTKNVQQQISKSELSSHTAISTSFFKK